MKTLPLLILSICSLLALPPALSSAALPPVVVTRQQAPTPLPTKPQDCNTRLYRLLIRPTIICSLVGSIMCLTWACVWLCQLFGIYQGYSLVSMWVATYVVGCMVAFPCFALENWLRQQKRFITLRRKTLSVHGRV